MSRVDFEALLAGRITPEEYTERLNPSARQAAGCKNRQYPLRSDSGWDARSMNLRTYVEPAKRWGWLAVAEEPTKDSQWFLPPIHKVWRPTKRMAHAAVPKAVERLENDVAGRWRAVRAMAEQRAAREDHPGPQ